MLKVEGLNAGYGSVNILWDIGFEVKDGEIVAILGSNGAGKTTMVRTITGMVKASSGKVEFNGEGPLRQKLPRYSGQRHRAGAGRPSALYRDDRAGKSGTGRIQ